MLRVLALLLIFGVQQQVIFPENGFLYIDGQVVYLINPETGERTHILAYDPEVYEPYWFDSPVGCLFSYQASGQGAPIEIFDIRTGEIIQRLEIPGATDAALSPNGRQIAYSTYSDADYSSSIHVFDRDSNSDQVVYTTLPGSSIAFPHNTSSVQWSPTGSHLLFRDYVWQIGRSRNGTRLLSLETGASRLLWSDDEFGGSPLVWSPNGQWLITIYVGSGDERADIVNEMYMAGEMGDIYLYHLPTMNNYRVSYTPRTPEALLRFSADNTAIIFNETATRSVHVPIADVVAGTTHRTVQISGTPIAQFYGTFFTNYEQGLGAITDRVHLYVTDLDGHLFHTVETTGEVKALGWFNIDSSTCR